MQWRGFAFALSGFAALSLAAGGCNTQKQKEQSELVHQTAASAGPQKVWLILKDQANVSAARSMKDWRARGQFVYNKLTQTADAAQAPLRKRLETLGVKHRPFWIINAIQVEADQSVIDQLARDPAVATVMRSQNYELPHPIPGTEQARVDAAPEWGVNNIKAPEVWSTYNVRGEGIVVANIDTGVQFDHPALVRQYRGNKGDGTFDHNYNWFDPSKVCGGTGLVPCDNHNHGTHTMGTMVGQDDTLTNQVGVAPGARWIAAKGCENTGVACSDTALLSSGQWMLAPTDLDGMNPRPDLRPHIVNNSWGTTADSLFYQVTVQQWVAAGIFPSFSNGNSGSGCNTAGSPAEYPEAYGVGAYDITNTIAFFSSRGASFIDGIIKPNISAPGVDVRSSFPGNTYGVFSGTSMAAPHLSGTVALMWSAAPSLARDIEATRALLDQTAIDTSDLSCGGTPENNNVYGQGRLDAFAAVTASPRCGTGELAICTVSVTPTLLEGGNPATGTVLLNGTAPAGGASVALASSDGLVTVPATVTVPAGSNAATFPVTTSQASAQTVVTLTATYPAGSSATATLTLLASPTPASVALDPSAVMGGQPSTGTVTLTGPAPSGGADVTLTSSATAVATVPATVTVPAGATSATFTVTTLDQLVNTSANISAAYHGLSKQATLTVNRTVPVGNATYDPGLKVPRCSTVDSFCDTGGLVDGRDTIAGGNEPNQPNTINDSCADSTGGFYHSDESQDRLKISTVDGTPLAPGKMVKVEATVYGYAGGGDAWDLYFAPDANNPVWVFQATKPQAGSGLQVMSHTFVLPSGPRPAIRGIWRYLGSPAPCAPGTFNEADDLVFAVNDDGGGGDTTPPTATITSPMDGALVGGTITLEATASDDVGVTKVELIANGNVIEPRFTPPYSWVIFLSMDMHQFQVKATDAAGNTGLSNIIHLTADTTPPTVAITSPANGATVSGMVTIDATAADNSVVGGVEFSADGTVLINDLDAPYSAVWDATAAAPGNHTLTAKATDSVGNVSTTSVTVVIAAPKQYTFLEAEDATTTSPLQKPADANASAGKAVQVAAGNNAPDPKLPPTNGHATLPFTASAAGDYVIWGRVTAPTDKDDSWWIRVDAGAWQRWNGIPAGAAYHWDDVHNDLVSSAVPVKFNLTAGPHTLEFAYREDGTRLDRFLVTNDQAFKPTGFGPPAAPTNVSATAGDQQVSLAWTTASGGPTSYNVKRGPSGGPYLTVKMGVTTTSAVDTGLGNGTPYCYVVSAVNANGEGPDSSPEKCATPVAPTVPQAPTDVTALAGNDQVTVMWTGSMGATSYNVKRGPKTGPFTTIADTSTVAYTDTTAMNGTEFCYVVSALNGAGESEDSTPPACATPAGFAYLYPQAESATLTTTAPALQKVNDTAASGGQAVQIPAGEKAPDANNPPTTGHGKITFTAPVAGSYKVWGRVTAPTNGDDSWWVRIDTGTWRRWNGIPLGSTYHWDDVHDDRAAPTGTGGAAVIFDLTAGSHTLEFAYREDGGRLDRFLITNDTAFTPSGTGP